MRDSCRWQESAGLSYPLFSLHRERERERDYEVRLFEKPERLTLASEVRPIPKILGWVEPRSWAIATTFITAQPKLSVISLQKVAQPKYVKVDSKILLKK